MSAKPESKANDLLPFRRYKQPIKKNKAEDIIACDTVVYTAELKPKELVEFIANIKKFICETEVYAISRLKSLMAYVKYET